MRSGLLFVSAFLVASAQSQPPLPGPGKSGQEVQPLSGTKKADGSSDNNPSQPPSIVVNQFNSQPTDRPQKPKGAQGNNESPFQGWADGLVALFTAALAAVAVLQWLTMRQQASHMREGLRATRDAADAATTSATALMNAERAWVVVTPKEWDPGVHAMPAVGAASRGTRLRNANVDFWNSLGPRRSAYANQFP
jgi:hypothetical protein